ncbi:hypothetical protein C8Q80DRAFT_1096843 [Daedaleopsis nitida]|nr:hypothetical protein C8Q80DRAFT_1096843 [Daedaleopsis nitida]
MAHQTGFAALPMRNQRGAPVWEPSANPTKTWALRFFDQVDRVITNYQIADDAEKKKTLAMYAEVDYVRMIESHPHFSDASKTYAELKKSLLEFFPGLEDSKRWTVDEYNAVVGEYLRRFGVSTLPEYLAFYRRLYPIALYLARDKPMRDLTEREVTSTMMKVLDGDLTQRVQARLSYKVAKDVNDSYKMEDVHEAICHCFGNDNPFKLRSIATWVNDIDIVECILDSGSQIVSCSVDKAHELGLSWDPTARITMMSANGEEQSTLGLARDVPMAISGGITVYLQMHIVQNASYDVLLGRPFEVLLSAEIRNEANGRQTLEVTCPNTGKRIAMPTYAKGTAPAGMCEMPMGFRRSRM